MVNSPCFPHDSTFSLVKKTMAAPIAPSAPPRPSPPPPLQGVAPPAAPGAPQKHGAPPPGGWGYEMSPTLYYRINGIYILIYIYICGIGIEIQLGSISI